jgi:ABC-type uncharacterized transport system substrate-binding protein
MPVPFDVGQWYKMYAEPTKQYCEEHGLDLHITEDDDFSGLFRRVERYLDDADVLFIPEGNLLLEMHRNLGVLCADKETPFFNGHDWGVRTSAALGYAMSLMPLGERAAAYAERILFNGERACDLPIIQQADTRHPLVNLTIAAEQGLDAVALQERTKSVVGIEFLETREG